MCASVPHPATFQSVQLKCDDSCLLLMQRCCQSKPIKPHRHCPVQYKKNFVFQYLTVILSIKIKDIYCYEESHDSKPSFELITGYDSLTLILAPL